MKKSANADLKHNSDVERKLEHAWRRWVGESRAARGAGKKGNACTTQEQKQSVTPQSVVQLDASGEVQM